VSPRTLTAQLKALLGARANGAVMLHTSMRSVGPVEGGALSLLLALREVVGSRGTLLTVISAREDAPFDYLRSEVDTSDMGIFAEVFRSFPGVQVNDHAAAVGAKLKYWAQRTLSRSLSHG
jgi:aminoglycoside 3-N-acetyltransferase